MSADALRRLLVVVCGEPDTSGGGSHQKFTASDGRTFTFAYHEREVSGSKVRSILVSDVGLTPAQARLLVQKGKL